MQTSPRNRTPEWTIHKLLRWTTDYFAARDIDSPRAAAEILLADSLELERIDLYLRHDQPLVQEELGRYKALIKRRLQREPVAYIVGRREFWSMSLDVEPAVLIPRPETECLVEQTLERLPPHDGARRRRVLELGTGSGAAILAVACERPGHAYFATDRSPAALRVAARNARRHRAAEALRLVCGDWFAPLDPEAAPFDLILSNPPYVPTGDIPGLQPEISRFEPRSALDGGPDGLQAIRAVVAGAPPYLRPGGHLLIEIGETQADAVGAIAADTAAYAGVRVQPDYSGRPRVACLCRRPPLAESGCTAT